MLPSLAFVPARPRRPLCAVALACGLSLGAAAQAAPDAGWTQPPLLQRHEAAARPAEPKPVAEARPTATPRTVTPVTAPAGPQASAVQAAQAPAAPSAAVAAPAPKPAPAAPATGVATGDSVRRLLDFQAQGTQAGRPTWLEGRARSAQAQAKPAGDAPAAGMPQATDPLHGARTGGGAR